MDSKSEKIPWKNTANCSKNTSNIDSKTTPIKSFSNKDSTTSTKPHKAINKPNPTIFTSLNFYHKLSNSDKSISNSVNKNLLEC